MFAPRTFRGIDGGKGNMDPCAIHFKAGESIHESNDFLRFLKDMPARGQSQAWDISVTGG